MNESILKEKRKERTSGESVRLNRSSAEGATRLLHEGGDLQRSGGLLVEREGREARRGMAVNERNVRVTRDP